MLCELSVEARLELAALAYKEWSEAYDNLKTVSALNWERSGKFCPKSDWPLTHQLMITEANERLDKYNKLRHEICKYSPLVIGE